MLFVLYPERLKVLTTRRIPTDCLMPFSWQSLMNSCLRELPLYSVPLSVYQVSIVYGHSSKTCERNAVEEYWVLSDRIAAYSSREKSSIAIYRVSGLSVRFSPSSMGNSVLSECIISPG